MAYKKQGYKAKVVRPIKLSCSLTSKNEVIITKGLNHEVRIFERIKDQRGLHKGELKIHLGDLLEALEVTPTVFKEARSQWIRMSPERKEKYYGQE